MGETWFEVSDRLQLRMLSPFTEEFESWCCREFKDPSVSYSLYGNLGSAKKKFLRKDHTSRANWIFQTLDGRLFSALRSFLNSKHGGFSSLNLVLRATVAGKGSGAVFIVKPVHSNTEIEISKKMGASGIGPRIYLPDKKESIRISGGQNARKPELVVEEYLGLPYLPLWDLRVERALSITGVPLSSNTQQFLFDLGHKLKALERDYQYEEDILTHLFYNSVNKTVRLVDFGNVKRRERQGGLDVIFEDLKEDLLTYLVPRGAKGRKREIECAIFEAFSKGYH